MENTIVNNKVVLVGTVESQFEFSHEVYGEKFYILKLKCLRLSETPDILPIMVSERLIDINNNMIGKILMVSGQLRTYNKHIYEKTNLIISVFAREIEVLQEATANKNYVYLEGYICKETIYRRTPLGREICDCLIAVNRPYGKSDYIPCISWRRNARYMDYLPVGQKLGIHGRLQSREYKKRLEDGKVEVKTVYEVSITTIEEN